MYVSPIKDGDYPLPCEFSRGYIRIITRIPINPPRFSAFGHCSGCIILNFLNIPVGPAYKNQAISPWLAILKPMEVSISTPWSVCLSIWSWFWWMLGGQTSRSLKKYVQIDSTWFFHQQKSHKSWTFPKKKSSERFCYVRVSHTLKTYRLTKAVRRWSGLNLFSLLRQFSR